MTPCSPPLCCDPGKPAFRDHSIVRAIASTGGLKAHARAGYARAATEMPAGAPLPIDGRANIRPDRFDLVHLQDAVPRRHVVLTADDRLDKAVVLAGAQSPEIERRPARKGLQLLAMAARAAVVIEGVALLDERLRGGWRCYHRNQSSHDHRQAEHERQRWANE